MLKQLQHATARLDIDEATFRREFPTRPFTMTHTLEDHPLLQLDALVEAATELPPDQLEYCAGSDDINFDPSAAGNGLSAMETIRSIEENQSWMALREIHRIPRYNDLLHELLAGVEPMSTAAVGPMSLPQAFVFVTSPGALTAYHMDNEHNFLLQIRGSKDVYLYDGADREIVSEKALEDFYAYGDRELEFREEHRRAEYHTDLQSGMGVHFPFTWPHYVVNGPEVSISLSLTWLSPELVRRKRLYKDNARLRAQGKTPRPIGVNRRSDARRDFRLRLQDKFRRLTGRG